MEMPKQTLFLDDDAGPEGDSQLEPLCWKWGNLGGGQKTPVELSPSWNLGTRTHLGLKAALWEVTALEPRRGLEIDYRSKLCLFTLIAVNIFLIFDSHRAILYRSSLLSLSIRP